MAPALLSRVFGVTAIGVGVIIGAAAGGGMVAQSIVAPAQAAPSAPVDVAVTLGADGITPSRTALMAGQAYRFVVTNSDAATHQFALESAGPGSTPLAANGARAAVDGIAKGATTDVTWTFSTPGDYQMSDDRAASEPGLVAPFTVVPADTPTLPVKLGDFTVKPTTTSLQAGKLYLFEVTNSGAATHEFVLESASAVDEPLAKVAYGAKMEAEAEDIAPGQTKEVLWSFATPGDYQMACHVPGHFEAGMKAAFKVVA